jgi:hypothetical protein
MQNGGPGSPSRRHFKQLTDRYFRNRRSARPRPLSDDPPSSIPSHPAAVSGIARSADPLREPLSDCPATVRLWTVAPLWSAAIGVLPEWVAAGCVVT